MADAGLSALLVSDPANMNYLTGYDAWSFYVHQLVVVLQDVERPLWIGRAMDRNAAIQTTWLDDNDLLAYGDEYVQSAADKHPMDYVAGVLADQGADAGTVGVEMDAYFFTARSYQRLERALAEATLRDATNLVNWVRLVKTDAELDYIRQATRLVEGAMETAMETIAPGVRQCDVVAEIYDALIAGTEEFGGEYPSIVPLMPTGEGTSTPHLTWTDDRLSTDEPVVLELAGCKRRYHSPMARTAYVGDPPDRLRELADVILEGMDAALGAIEPGVTCESVERAWRESIAAHGYEKESRIGYAMGLGYPPDWGEHTASFRPGDETVLREDMTFHLIPGIWLSDVGVEISEAIRVTDSGVEVFGNFPRDLHVR